MRVDLGIVVPGMVLETSIIKDDVLLVKKGSKLTPALINRLKTFGITSVDIVSEKNLAKNVSSTDTEDSDLSFTVTDSLTNDVREALLENNIEKIEDSASKMVEAIKDSIDLNGSFTNFKYDLQSYNKDNDSLEHSIRVAAFSIALAHLYNEQLKKSFNAYDKSDERLVNLDEIAVASLLHDRGRNCYSEKTLENIEKLSNNAKLRNILPGLADVPLSVYEDKYIPVYSLALINDDPRLSDNIKYMILYSSEMENGNGPLRAKGFEKNNLFSYISGAKILHLCSLYDDYLSHCVHENESFENIVTIIGHAASHGVINENLANLFLNNIPIYSAGNKVLLSTGEKATVIKSSTGYTDTTRPKVRVDSSGEVIDLGSATTITIIRIADDDLCLEDIVDGQLAEVDKRIGK